MSRKAKNLMVLLVLVFLGLAFGYGRILSRSKGGTVLAPVNHTALFNSQKISLFPTQLKVVGNTLQNTAGETLLLHGLAWPDPAYLKQEDKFQVDVLDAMHTDGANTVRIAVDPQQWVNDSDYLWRYLSSIVDWAGSRDLYVIITWNATGNPTSGEGLNVQNLAGQPKDLTREFWTANAKYFQAAPNVIFELFAEPVNMTSNDWRSAASDLVQAIRAQGFSNLILVNGIDASRDLSWVQADPIQDDNVAYAVHVYPEMAQSDWAKNFGDLAATYPVVVTEWGYMDENRTAELTRLAGDDTGYGAPLLAYLDTQGMGWIAGYYDNVWTPPMFSDAHQTPTRFGQFVLDHLSAP